MYIFVCIAYITAKKIVFIQSAMNIVYKNNVYFILNIII